MNFSIPTRTGDRSFSSNAVGKVLTVATLIFALGLFGYYAHALLLKYPPVWPDEPIYTNTAIDLIRHGVFGFTLFGDIFPGALHHSFLVPPVYVIYSCATFSIWGIGIVQARLGSVAAAAAVMLLTYGVARQSGQGRWTALVPVSLLALDTLFLRGALVARADMLELALLLLSLYLVAPFLDSGTHARPMRLFCAGVASGLAMLMPPTGTIVSIVFLVGLAVAAAGNRKRVLPALLGGLAVPTLAWFAYAALHWRDLLLQFGKDIASKAGRHPMVLLHIRTSLQMDLSQYGGTSALVVVAWAGGLAGLLLSARRNKFARLAVVLQVAIFVVMIWGEEIWYGLYLVPLTMVGLVQLATLAAEGGSWWDERALRKIAGWAAVFLALWMAQNSMVTTASFNYAVNGVFARETNYISWARQVSREIPTGSTVLLSIIPDPYFVLCRRTDLSLREFIPGIPVSSRKEIAYMEGADYILARGPYPSKMVWDFVHSHARLVKQVGSPFGWGYHVGIYKVIKNKPAGAE